MGAKLEIEIVDAGANVAAPANLPVPAGAGAMVSPPPAVASTGATTTTQSQPGRALVPLQQEDAGRQLTTVGEGLRVLTGAIGYGGGLLSVTGLLTRSFSELSQVASDIASRSSSERSLVRVPTPEGAGTRVNLPAPVQSASQSTLVVPQSAVVVPPGAGAPIATAAVAEGAGVASAAGPAILALGAFAAGVGLATASVSSFMNKMKDEADSLSKFSPELASATAASDMRMVMAEMARAQEIGPSLAKFEDERSRIEVKLYETVTRIEKFLLEYATPAMRTVANAPDLIDKLGAFWAAIGNDFAGRFEAMINGNHLAMLGEAKQAGGMMEKMVQIWKKIWGGEEERPPDFEGFLEMLMGVDQGRQQFGPQLPALLGRGRRAPGL